MPTFVDPLASELWDARLRGRLVAAFDHRRDVDLTRGEAIAAELYRALEEVGGKRVGWKLGAVDRRTQAVLGTDVPFLAPIYSQTVLDGRRLVHLQSLVAPRLEAEIALRISGRSASPMACIEIVDCRFPAWRVTLPEAVADFGLQGGWIFGSPMDSKGTVEARVYLDGSLVTTGSRTIADARTALEHVPGADGDTGQETVIATGSLVQPVPLSAGRWRVDFGSLGTLTLEVES